MPETSTFLILAVGLTFFCAGVVKGVTGMGLPTLAMAVLGALLSPVAAAALLIAPSLVTNVWQLFAGPSVAKLGRRLWPMMVLIAVGTLVGSSVLASGDTRVATSALGIVLVAYASYTLLARQLRAPSTVERWASPIVGFVTGLLTGATGVFVVPAVPYLQALELEKEDLVQALGLSFTVSTIALAVALSWRAGFRIGDLGTSALAIPPALAGMWFGQVIRRRISASTFRRWFLFGLLLLGSEMLLRPLL